MSESTFAYFHAARAYLDAWGKPVAFYSDKHGVFHVFCYSLNGSLRDTRVAHGGRLSFPVPAT